MKHCNPYLKQCVRVITIMTLFVLGSGFAVMAKEYSSLHRGVRPLGMGGAFTAVADDKNSLFYNPAGLSKLSTFQIDVFNPLFEGSENCYDLYNDLSDVDLDDTGATADILRQYTGEHQQLRVALFPNIGLNIAKVGVMIGGLGQVELNADIHNPVWPEAHVDMVVDYGLLAGAGIELPVTGLSVGIAAKMLYRKSLNEVYTATEIAADDFEDRIDDDLHSGSGISADIGFMYELSDLVPLLDTRLALVVQNVPEMKMSDAKDIKTQANFGLAVEKDFKAFSIVGALDYMDITNNINEDDDMAKRLHLGAEAKLLKILSVRAGLNQGYFTAGVGINLRIFRFDVATYGEEVGAHAGQRADRRYVAQFSFGW